MYGTGTLVTMDQEAIGRMHEVLATVYTLLQRRSFFWRDLFGGLCVVAAIIYFSCALLWGLMNGS